MVANFSQAANGINRFAKLERVTKIAIGITPEAKELVSRLPSNKNRIEEAIAEIKKN